MEKTSRTESANLLISKKAYNDFATRIRQTLDAITISPESIAEAIDLLDGYVKYVKGETTDLDSTDTMVKVALMMLKPEIDKAMRRSSSARERVRLRREKSHQIFTDTTEDLETSGSPECADSPVSSFPSAERPMNRRERREYEQELAREQRRYERRMKRMKN